MLYFLAKVVQDELHHLDNYIAATQLGITLASLALGWISEPSGYALPACGLSVLNKSLRTFTRVGKYRRKTSDAFRNYLAMDRI